MQEADGAAGGAGAAAAEEASRWPSSHQWRQVVGRPTAETIPEFEQRHLHLKTNYSEHFVMFPEHTGK